MYAGLGHFQVASMSKLMLPNLYGYADCCWEMEQYKMKPLKFNLLLRSSTKYLL